jgi:hypothetical protein
MKRYIVTSAHCFIAASAWQGAEYAPEKIIFSWNSTEHKMRPCPCGEFKETHIQANHSYP